MHTEHPSREIRFPSAVFRAMRAALAQQEVPVPVRLSTLRAFGFALGEPLSREVEARITGRGNAELRDVTSDAFWDALTAAFDALGWGTFQFEPAHPGVGALTSENWAEAEGREGLSHPGCHLTTGLLSDVLGRVSPSEVAVLEVECRGSGDPHCRFLFGAPEILETVFGRLREGAGASEALDALA